MLSSEPISERVRSIRSKLIELTRLDASRQIFGSGGPYGHGYFQKAPLDTRQLSALESNFGVELPNELRVFLSEVHSGGAGPGCGLLVSEDSTVLPRRSMPFPFDDAAAQRVIAARLGGSDPWASLEMPKDWPEEDDDDWPPGPGFIPMAHHGCGIFDVIVTTGPQRGLVWCCDMRWCPAFDRNGRPFGFLDWYETWLDASSRQLSSHPTS